MDRGRVIEFCIVSNALLVLSVLLVPEAINLEVSSTTLLSVFRWKVRFTACMGTLMHRCWLGIGMWAEFKAMFVNAVSRRVASTCSWLMTYDFMTSSRIFATFIEYSVII